MTELLKIWKAHGDGGERSMGPVLAYCSTADKANEIAKGKGWYGGDGCVNEAFALRVDGNVWLLERKDPIDLDSTQKTKDAELRRTTLAELSADQRRVLGLSLNSGEK